MDWDDTIGDWKESEHQALQRVYEKYRLSEFFASYEEYYRIYHEHNVALWEQYGRQEITKTFLQRDRFLWPIVQSLGGDSILMKSQAFQQRADQIGNDFLNWTNEYFHLIPGAEDVVRYLAQRYPLTFISNGFGEVQHYKLEHSGIAHLFKHILISEEVGVNKPNPQIYQIALERNGVSADEAIMIGDSYFSDISGAKAVGIDQIWICPHSVRESEQSATYIVTSLAQVTDIL